MLDNKTFLTSDLWASPPLMEVLRGDSLAEKEHLLLRGNDLCTSLSLLIAYSCWHFLVLGGSGDTVLSSREVRIMRLPRLSMAVWWLAEQWQNIYGAWGSADGVWPRDTALTLSILCSSAVTVSTRYLQSSAAFQQSPHSFFMVILWLCYVHEMLYKMFQHPGKGADGPLTGMFVLPAVHH